MTERDSFKINTEAFFDMQSAFFKCTHTYGFCMDLDAIRITDFSGEKEYDDFLSDYVTMEMERGIIVSLRSNPYEDVVRMDTGYRQIMLGGIAIRDGEGLVRGVMVVIGAEKSDPFLSDGEAPVDTFAVAASALDIPGGMATTTESEYASALTLATVVISHYFREKNEGVSLRDRLKRQEESSSALSKLLEKSELITGILKRMESDDDFPKVSEAILSDVGEYLDVSNAALLRLSPDEEYVDMISEWAAGGAAAFMPDFLHVKREELPFFTGRPFTISSDALLPDDFKEYFKKYDIRAGVYLPLFISERLGMYILFTVSGRDRGWSSDELVILNDVKRIMQTILTKRVTKNSLASSYAVLDAILDNTGCGVCVRNDSTGELLYTNELFLKMFSHNQDLEEFSRYIIGKSGSGKGEYHLIHADIRCDLSYIPIRWVDGRPVTLCTLYDVSELYEYQKRLEKQAVTDTLTGLGNRISFEKEIRECIRDAVRAAEQGSFVYIDLDDFKDINDSAGHSVGDEILMQVADALSLICRGRATVYRLGGDEFAVLIPHQTIDAEGLIESIFRRFAREFTLDSGKYFCSATFAVTQFPADGTRIDALMQKADTAMWAGKSAGKSRIEYYRANDNIRSARRISMERELRASVENGCEGFELCLSPIIGKVGDVLSCVGAEASLCWKSQTLGEVAPEEFIPLAEYLGLIVPLGRHILHMAFSRCRYWNDFGHPGYRVVVDMSLVQLLRSDIVDVIESEIEATGVDVSLVTVRFKEWGKSYYKIRIERALGRIRELGITPVKSSDEGGTGEVLSMEEFEDKYVRGVVSDKFS